MLSNSLPNWLPAIGAAQSSAHTAAANHTARNAKTKTDHRRPALTSISLHDGQHWLPQNWQDEIAAESKNPVVPTSTMSDQSNRLIIIDGYEQLAWLQRVRLRTYCRRRGARLARNPTSPSGSRLSFGSRPTAQLVERLVADLCAQVSTAITPADIAASHACHGSNVREIFFDLYDCHEQRRRESNSLSAAS